MQMGRCCQCAEFDYVNVKSFASSDGSWQWEKKALRVMVSHNGTVRLYRQREVSGWMVSTMGGFVAGAGLGMVPLRPNATGNNQWTTRTAANIDDAISAPAGVGDGAICQAIGPTDNNKEQQWTVSGSYTAGSNQIAAVSIWILAKKTENTQPASISAVKFRTNGVWYTAAGVPSLTTSYAWHRIDIENTTTTPWTLATSSPAVALTAIVPDAAASIEVETVYVDALCTLGSGGFAYPTGTAPTGRYKQYAIDSVTVASDGTETVNATDCELFEVERNNSSPDPRARRGLPTSVPTRLAVPQVNTPQLKDTSCSDSGLVIDNVVPQIQIFDPWKRSQTKKYRFCIGWQSTSSGAFQIALRRFGTSATLTHGDSAATIEAALETIDGVVTATVTGGPLFTKNVDVEIEWASATDQFHSAYAVNASAPSTPVWSIVDIDTYELVGYDSTAYVNGFAWASDGTTDVLISTKANITSGGGSPVPWLFVTRVKQETDANGWKFYDDDAAWSSKVTTVAIEQANGYTGQSLGFRVSNGYVIGSHNRRNFSSSSNKYNYWLLDEADGSGLPNGAPTDQYLNGTGDTGHLDITSLYVSDNDKHVFHGTKSGLYDPLLLEMPNVPNQLTPDRNLLCGQAPFKSDAEYLWSSRQRHGNTAALVTLQLSERYGVSTTLVSGGDAFFPTHTYNKRVQIFQGTSTRYRGNTIEFRFLLGQLSGSTWVSSTVGNWIAGNASDATVEAELNALRGDTSASTPVITVAIPGASADDEALPWFYRGAEVVICMQRSGNATDISVDNLVEFGASLRIEIRNANVERFLQISKETFDDGSIQWQRDVGVPALSYVVSGINTVVNALVVDNGSQILAYNGWWKPLPVDDTTVYEVLP